MSNPVKSWRARLELTHVNDLGLAPLLLLYLLTWVVSHLVSDTNLDPYGDMLENYIWGQTFEWGTDKHPPLVGWVTGLWFSLLPERQAFYHLLSYGWAALGLAGVYELGRALGLGTQPRLMATLMMSLALPFSTLAVKFNANSILLPLWPWLCVAWLYSRDQRGNRQYLWTLALGLLAGLSLLGKYYSGVLLVALGLLTLLHSNGRAWLRTPHPWLAGLIACLVLAPHLLWLMDNNFSSLDYVEAQGSGAVDMKQLGKFILAPLAYWLTAWLACLATIPGHWPRGIWRSWLPMSWGDELFWLAWLPYLITLGFGVTGFVVLSMPWAIPMGFAFTLLWYRNLTRAQTETQQAVMTQRGRRIFLGWLCLILLLSPVYAWHQGENGTRNYYLPREEAASLTLNLWAARQPGHPDWAAGDYPEAGLLAFYGDPAIRILEELPVRPTTGGVIFCPLGPAEPPRYQSPCTLAADAWSAGREEQVTKIEFTVEKSGPRFMQDLPFRYQVYFYQPTKP